MEAFVADWCLNVQDRLVRAFPWGYAGHLMVDRLWARRLYMPLVRDNPRAKEVYQLDLRAVDRELACEPGAGVVLTRSLKNPAALVRDGLRGLAQSGRFSWHYE